MQSKQFNNVRITGIACAVPNNKVSSDNYINTFGEERVQKFKEATGINARYLSDGKQTASDLCYVAAKALMEKKNITGDDIDALIFITQKPDYRTPSTAFVIQKRLEIKQDCLVFDINLGCSAFVNGVYFLSGLVESHTVNKALLLIGDADTNHKIFEDVSQTMMFGDGGAAILIESGDGNICGMIRSDGGGYKTLISPMPGYRFPESISGANVDFSNKMDGNDTFLFTITKVPKLFKEFYKIFSTTNEDYDYFILHQANLMIVNQIAKKLQLPGNKVPISLGEYGNTDGATIPIGIANLCQKINKPQKLKLITSGYGIGLSWGIVSFELNTEDVLPIIITADYYLEGKNV